MSIRKWGLFGICALALQVLAQGRIERFEMPTNSALNDRPILFYVPADYSEQDTTRYPVLYLFHGVNGDENSWSVDGNIQVVLDSMINNHIIRPCIVVMPNTNSGKYIWNKHDRSTLRNLLGYFKNRKGNFMLYFEEIAATTDSLYRICPDPTDHAIAGLSNGAFQAAVVSSMYPGQFAWVGLFSPVVFKQQVPDVGEEWCMNPSLPNGTRYWISVGDVDIFRSYGVRYAQKLRKKHIPCVLVSDKGGHNWRVWQTDLERFVRTVYPFDTD